MARPDLYPSHGTVSSYSSASCATPAAERMPPPYADPRTAATMTKPLYDQSPTPNDGHFYPIYPDFYDFSNAGHNAAAAVGAAGGGCGVAGGQAPPDFSEMGHVEGGYPPSWDYGPDDLDLSFPPTPPGIVRGEEAHVLQPQVPWDREAQAYPAMMGSSTMAMASPMSQYHQPEEPMGGSYGPRGWPPPPMGQISPSPSQSSYHASSPASAGPQFSRHNSVSSLAAAVDQTRFDVRFRPVPDQTGSADEGQPTAVGTVVNNGLYPGAEPSSYAGQMTRPRTKTRSQRATTAMTMTTGATTDYNAGTLSPAITPSPKDAIAAVPYQSVSQSASRATDQQQTPKSSGKKAPAPGRRIAPQKPGTAAKQGQAKQAQPQPQDEARPAPPTQRTRNRDAANKCRAKTKLAVADLESTERAMSTEHRELAATARGLRDEVLLLKNELLAHGNCDDSLIRQYLTNQARMVGNGPILQLHQHHQQRQ